MNNLEFILRLCSMLTTRLENEILLTENHDEEYINELTELHAAVQKIFICSEIEN